MKTKTVVVIVFPESCGLLMMELLGRRVGDFLLSSLNDMPEAEVRVAFNGNVQDSHLFEKFPNFAKCQLAELWSTMPVTDGLLIIDARAWFSSTALTAMFSQVRCATNTLQFVEFKGSNFSFHREAMTLAVYLRPEMLHSDRVFRELTSHGNGLDQIVNADAIASESVFAFSGFNSPNFALMLASLVDIAELERLLLLGRAIEAMKQGIHIRDPNSVYIRGDLVCGLGVTVEPNVIVEGSVVLGNGVKIGANSILRNCRIGPNTNINPFSLVEQSSIGSGSFIGPYGRIRPGSVIGDNVQIGNYVEIKSSRIGDGSRINHHTFIGDALLSKQVTIGAGTITCNHDGVGTHQTVIEQGAYVGSGCNLVAPLHIGESAVIGAGSTITRDVPAAKLTIARQQQTTIESWLGPKTWRLKS